LFAEQLIHGRQNAWIIVNAADSSGASMINIEQIRNDPGITLLITSQRSCEMKTYRVTEPISVMLKKENSYVPSHIPKGAIVSLKEIPIDLNRHVIVDWNGRSTLMFGPELLVRAEPVSEDEAVDAGIL
jgi:hypothetical protein